jgi:hypothetical protein
MSEEFKITIDGEPGPTDIVFDCVQCGRSLCIDGVAAGFVITCPHCQAEQRVPGEMQEPGPEEPAGDEQDPGATVEATDSGTIGGDTVVMENPLFELQDRVALLERHIIDQNARFEQISRELVMIQAALDRMVSTLSDAISTLPGQGDAASEEASS